MRGQVERQQAFGITFNIDECIPQEHPLRRIKELVDAELTRLGPIFRRAYSDVGRPSIPPE